MTHEKLRSTECCWVTDNELGSPLDFGVVPGSEIRISGTVIGTVPWVTDHRELLKKYIEHVSAREGSDLLCYIDSYNHFPKFTDNERRELQQISRELDGRP
jgi:hypothetical protein